MQWIREAAKEDNERKTAGRQRDRKKTMGKRKKRKVKGRNRKEIEQKGPGRTDGSEREQEGVRGMSWNRRRSRGVRKPEKYSAFVCLIFLFFLF